MTIMRLPAARSEPASPSPVEPPPAAVATPPVLADAAPNLPASLPAAAHLPLAAMPNPMAFERRLSTRALAAWQHSSDSDALAALAPFFDNSVLVRDPAGRAIIEQVGAPVSARFGLIAGLPLHRDPGLNEELVAACELVALQPMPMHFEASVHDPLGTQMLVRAIALPLAEHGDPVALVQIVLSWRELLSNSAAARLRAELAQAFAGLTASALRPDPFPRLPSGTSRAPVRSHTYLAD
jgi:hypothetical protein